MGPRAVWEEADVRDCWRVLVGWWLKYRGAFDADGTKTRLLVTRTANTDLSGQPQWNVYLVVDGHPLLLRADRGWEYGVMPVVEAILAREECDHFERPDTGLWKDGIKECPTK